MGYSYRNEGQIKDFWPDNTDDTIYIESSSNPSLLYLMEVAQQNWPGVELSDITISSENIHTSCLTYDMYDPSDYTDFIIITKN